MKNRTFSIAFLLFTVLVLACKKDNGGGDERGNDKKDIIISEVKKIDSLKNFTALLNELNTSGIKIENGVTVFAISDVSMTKSMANVPNIGDYVVNQRVSFEELSAFSELLAVSGGSIKVTKENGMLKVNNVQLSSNLVYASDLVHIYTLSGFYTRNSGLVQDPHAGEYFVDYFINGTYRSLKGFKITSWPFYNNSHFSSTDTRYSGVAISLEVFASQHPFQFLLNRKNYTETPIVQKYSVSNQSTNIACNLEINGATYMYDAPDKDSYVNIEVTDVEVRQDLGLEKRGFYKGVFDAVLYKKNEFGALEKYIISGGRFYAPIGGNAAVLLSGIPPVSDRLNILQSGKWYFHSMANGDQLPACNLDDYIHFKQDGLCDVVSAGVQCPPHTGEVDFASNLRYSLNATGSALIIEGDEYPILSISNSELIFWMGEFVKLIKK